MSPGKNNPLSQQKVDVLGMTQNYSRSHVVMLIKFPSWEPIELSENYLY